MQADALWDSYLGFEKRVLSSTDEQEAQKQVVLKLFHRRLGIPLAGLERSKGEYEAWLAEASIEDPGVELPLELTMKRTQALAEIEPTLHNGASLSTPPPTPHTPSPTPGLAVFQTILITKTRR